MNTDARRKMEKLHELLGDMYLRRCDYLGVIIVPVVCWHTSLVDGLFDTHAVILWDDQAEETIMGSVSELADLVSRRVASKYQSN